MSRYHNVLDASALVKKYRKETGWEILQLLFRRKDCSLHILNITIPEIIGVFVRYDLNNEIKKGEWKNLKTLFIDDIVNYSVIVHNITHRNIVDTDAVWETSMSVQRSKPKRQKRVGSNDVLVLSVASELKKIYGYNNVYLFSSDTHMLKVASRMKIKNCNAEAVMKLPF